MMTIGGAGVGASVAKLASFDTLDEDCANVGCANAPNAVFGWPSTHEGAGTTAVSKAGCYVMCAAAENLSLFATVLSKAVRLPAAAVLRTLNASKNYITFQTSECSIDCLG